MFAAVLSTAMVMSAAGLATPALQNALEAALTVPGARLEVARVDGRATAGCQGDEAQVSRPIETSGRVAVKLQGRANGRACTSWLWADVRVFANVAVTTRALRAGESLDGAVGFEERELRAGLRPWLEPTGTTTRALGRGVVLEASHVRTVGVRSGEPVKVLVLSGALAIEQTGRTVACGRDRFCAVLPSGRHVEGVPADGRLLVRMP